MRLFNILMVVLLLVILTIIILKIYISEKNNEDNDDEENKNFAFSYLKRGIDADFKEIIYSRPEDLGVSYEESRKRQEMKIKLSDAKRDAPVGKESSKILLTTEISRMLEMKYLINEITIDNVFPFSEPSELSNHNRFLVLMFTVMKEKGYDAWCYLIKTYHLDELRLNGRFEIYQSDIDNMFTAIVTDIPYEIKLSVLSQRIYEDIFGHGKADLLIWQDVEEISLGTGGIVPDSDGHLPMIENAKGKLSDYACYNHITCLYSGKTLHLRFLGLGSEKELERVCRHIYQYRNPGEMTEREGYKENEMADGSRVVAFRKGFGDSWGCTVRKHGHGHHLKRARDMYSQKGCEELFLLLEALMKGCQSALFTGQMYSGKTTLLKAMVDMIDPNFNLRGLESVFEMDLRNLFPDRDAATFRESDELVGDKVLEFLKRTSGNVLLLGELLKEVSANWLVSAGQSGFKMVLTTTHTKTAEAMVKWLLKAILNTSGSTCADLVMLDIVNALHFDIHCGINVISGERYVERITEFVPTGDEKIYKTVDIMLYDDEKKEYVICNPLTKRTLDEIRPYYKDNENYGRLLELFAQREEVA